MADIEILARTRNISLGKYTLIVVNIKFGSQEIRKRFIITFYVHNVYYAETTWNMSNVWSAINCDYENHTVCFDSIHYNAEKSAELNRYFWFVKEWQLVSSEICETLVVGQIKKTGAILDIHKIAISLSLAQFFGFWIFQDVVLELVNNSVRLAPPNYRTIHVFEAKDPVRAVENYYHYALPVYMTSFSFLSCHEVGRESFSFKMLFTSFHELVWISLALSVLAVAVLVRQLGETNFSGEMLIGIGIILENSVLLDHEVRYRQVRKHHIRIIILPLVLLLGTMTTNVYKSSFTKELIVPNNPISPWRTVLDIVTFRFYIPIESIITSDNILRFEPAGILEYMFYVVLESVLDFRSNCSERASSLELGYCKVAALLHDSLKLITPKMLSVNSTQLQPVRFNRIDDFIRKLSICNQTAYLDVTENVDKVLPFLNDNADGRLYMKGEDGFLKSGYGWAIQPVRNSFVWTRLKVMMSSGMYSYWDAWYKRVKPVKTFQNFANWTYPRVDPVTRLKFNSKISAGFFVYGICIGVVLLVGCLEVMCDKLHFPAMIK